jgi:cobalt-precorrin 5A hydrolase / precorrin-3B C17-methyltransferase
MKPAIVILSAEAMPLAQRLKDITDGQIHAPASVMGADRHFQFAVAHLATIFQQGRSIVAACASGIVVRALAPHLESKHSDPPVVVVSEDGKSVIPLLGGHHGANELALKLAKELHAHAAITTASDIRLNVALDVAPEGFVLANSEAAKSATSRMLKGEKLSVKGDAKWLAAHASSEGTVPVAVTTHKPTPGTLTFHPRSLVIGVGCERGTDPAEVSELVRATLETHSLAVDAVAYIATIDLKEDETAINALGHVRFFTTKELNAESHRIQKPSEIVRAEVGTPSVAEAAALAGAGPDSVLIVPKTKSERATCAIAQAPGPITEPFGRPRGVVHVIGLGPGTPDMRSPEATSKLSLSNVWVGYELYIDLAMDVYSGQMIYKFPLGAEEQRVIHAINQAKQGKRVALICSGDAGIYAMAALVYERLAIESARIGVDVVPGISAFQAAAARAGAVIGHDFCCISLSDLLTPWETIEKRLQAAAFGDFVVALYNPRSLKRKDQLPRAIEILEAHRKDTTPVIIASNLGRPDEKIKVVALGNFNPEDVDMLTVVLIGSSQSQLLKRGDGKTYAFTPRGYEKKREA